MKLVISLDVTFQRQDPIKQREAVNKRKTAINDEQWGNVKSFYFLGVLSPSFALLIMEDFNCIASHYVTVLLLLLFMKRFLL